MGLEKGKDQKKIHVTFSIPVEVNSMLHSVVGKPGLSEFVTNALRKALEEERNSLRKAYAAANEDPDRKKTIDDWSVLDTGVEYTQTT